MEMITEDYVSFETAKLLKEKGFRQKEDSCGYYATEMVYCIKELNDGSHHFCHQWPACFDKDNEYIVAPTLQMTMKWLREVHHLFIFLSTWRKVDSKDQYYYEIRDLHTDDYDTLVSNVSDSYSYEEAVEEAIKYCLENLI